MVFLGFHSYSIILFTVALNWALYCYDPTSLANSAVTLVGSLPLVLLVEYRIGSVFYDLQQKNQSLSMLLDKATDGFCSVDEGTGIIRSASPQLEKTLGAPGNLVGRRLFEFVQSSDHISIQAVLNLSPDARKMEPMLLSFAQEQSQVNVDSQVVFDARLIPFTTSDRMLQLCLQVQGEMRTRSKAAPACQTDMISSSSLCESDVCDVVGTWQQYCGSELPPIRKSPSEVSFEYSMTNSVCSKSFHSSPVRTRVGRFDAAVQTSEVGNFESCWVEHNLHAVANESAVAPITRSAPELLLNRPPRLPGSTTQAASQVSRGRSPVKRLRSPPKGNLCLQDQALSSQDVVLRIGTAVTKSDKHERIQDQALSSHDVVLRIGTAGTKSDQNKGRIQDVQSETALIPEFPVAGKKPGARRKRLGADVSKM